MSRSVILKSWKMCASCTIDDSVTCKEHSKDILEFARLMVNPVKFYLRYPCEANLAACGIRLSDIHRFELQRGALVCL
jgi:hypothetical protein